jgi:hypothetical protein
MSDFTVDGLAFEVGDKISIFLVAASIEDLAKECDRIPLYSQEKLIEMEGVHFRKAFIFQDSDPKYNGMLLVPWDKEKNARAIAYQKANPRVDGIYRVSSGSWSDGADRLKKTFSRI